MESKVYSKSDILDKLSQDGFFVDYLTLDSFLSKYKIEAIYEDDSGNEFFDKCAYDTLVENVLGKKKEEVKTSEDNVDFSAFESTLSSAPAESDDSKLENKTEEVVLNEEVPLENIKWHKWDDVSVELVEDKKEETQAIADSNITENKKEEEISLFDGIERNKNSQEGIIFDTEQNSANGNSFTSDTSVAQQNTAFVDANTLSNESALEDSKKEIQQIMSSQDDNEEDFDDIGLISDSIQVQEKFQSYIANELAKRNTDINPPVRENTFKFDISEKTLNMIARAIAKKIAKQVAMLVSFDERSNNTKLLQAEKKSQMLEQRISTLEEQNRKLKLLLVESNKNLNSYKPTFFGLYKFVRKKTKKRR